MCVVSCWITTGWSRTGISESAECKSVTSKSFTFLTSVVHNILFFYCHSYELANIRFHNYQCFYYDVTTSCASIWRFQRSSPHYWYNHLWYHFHLLLHVPLSIFPLIRLEFWLNYYYRYYHYHHYYYHYFYFHLLLKGIIKSCLVHVMIINMWVFERIVGAAETEWWID